MRTIRQLLGPSPALVRRVFIVLFAVSGLVIGLIAMHSLDLGTHHGIVVPSHSTEAPDMHHAGSIDGVAGVAVSDSCDGTCPQTMPMSGACVLALLLMLFAPLRGAAMSGWSPRTRASTDAAQPGATALPPPPSLVLLSISRT